MKDKRYVLEFQRRIFALQMNEDYKLFKPFVKDPTDLFKGIINLYNRAKKGDVVIATTSKNYGEDGMRIYHGMHSKLEEGKKYRVERVHARYGKLEFYYVLRPLDMESRVNYFRINCHPDSVQIVGKSKYKNEGLLKMVRNRFFPNNQRKIAS